MPTILVAEDSLTARIFLRHLLLEALPSASILEAEDGMTALKAMTQSKVDLIVTDLMMPGMDGQSLLNVLRRNPMFRTKPVLIVSGATQILDPSHADDRHLKVLPKPPHLEQIQRALQSLLG